MHLPRLRRARARTPSSASLPDGAGVAADRRPPRPALAREHGAARRSGTTSTRPLRSDRSCASSPRRCRARACATEGESKPAEAQACERLLGAWRTLVDDNLIDEPDEHGRLHPPSPGPTWSRRTPTCASGDLAMGTYAANLAVGRCGQAAAGADVYADPEQFFASTYFTAGDAQGCWTTSGRRSRRRERRPGPSAADAVRRRQDPHAARPLPPGDRRRRRRSGVPELAGLPDPGAGPHGGALRASTSTRSAAATVDGRRIQTLWGELAYQLGGWEAYEAWLVDGEEGAPPGGELLGRLLGGEPTLILLDEVLIYVAKGRGGRAGRFRRGPPGDALPPEPHRGGQPEQPGGDGLLAAGERRRGGR